jgi:hypothetical protein
VKIQDPDLGLIDKVHPNIKHLQIRENFGSGFEFSAAQLTHKFPNLHFLKIDCVCLEVTEPFFVELLSELKRLKTLKMRNIESKTKLNSRFVLPCFEKYGNHLETVHVKAVQSWFPLETTNAAIGFTIDKEPNEGYRYKQVFGHGDDYNDL